MSAVQVGGIYRHYKGKLYYVLALATHTETMERLVVYVPFNEPKTARAWVRPETMFVENLHIDGKVVPRFSYENSR